MLTEGDGVRGLITRDGTFAFLVVLGTGLDVGHEEGIKLVGGLAIDGNADTAACW